MTREELVDKAREVLRLRHLALYGVEAVDEQWLNAQPDAMLRFIIESK